MDNTKVTIIVNIGIFFVVVFGSIIFFGKMRGMFTKKWFKSLFKKKDKTKKS